MARSIKNLTFTLVLALGGLGLGGCAEPEETELVDETADAVEFGNGALPAMTDVDDGDSGAGEGLELRDAPVNSEGLHAPGADMAEPEPEPWTGPCGGHSRVQQDHGDPDASAEAKHMNAI